MSANQSSASLAARAVELAVDAVSISTDQHLGAARGDMIESLLQRHAFGETSLPISDRLSIVTTALSHVLVTVEVLAEMKLREVQGAAQPAPEKGPGRVRPIRRLRIVDEGLRDLDG